MAYNRNTVEGNKSFKQLVLGCFFRAVLASVLAFILYVSFTVMASGFSTKAIGYNILFTEDEGQTFETVYTYYYTGEEEEDWIDPNLEKYEDDERYYKETLYSELSAGTTKTIMWISQVVSFVVWMALIYGLMWNVGDADANKSEMGHAKLDKWRGVKAALCAEIPFFALYIILFITQSLGVFESGVTIYKAVTYNCFAINQTFLPVINKELVVTVPGLLGLLLDFVPMPVFAGISYYIGRKHMVLKEKILYKK